MSYQTSNAVFADVPQILSIYNWYILNTTATLDTNIIEESKYSDWFNNFTTPYSVYVIKNNRDEVHGWSCLKRWSNRIGYEGTCEISIYIHHKMINIGLGRELMSYTLSQATESHQIRNIIARIGEESLQSIDFHKKFGFYEIGTMSKVGHKFDRFLDVHLLQKQI